jgi:hypothetical protein
MAVIVDIFIRKSPCNDYDWTLTVGKRACRKEYFPFATKSLNQTEIFWPLDGWPKLSFSSDKEISEVALLSGY